MTGIRLNIAAKKKKNTKPALALSFFQRATRVQYKISSAHTFLSKLVVERTRFHAKFFLSTTSLLVNERARLKSRIRTRIALFCFSQGTRFSLFSQNISFLFCNMLARVVFMKAKPKKFFRPVVLQNELEK